MKERWLPVVGYEGLYEVSNLGRVKSLDRVDGQGRNWPGRIRKLCATRGGYASVGLSLPGRGARTHRVNVLVLMAFRFPRPAHKDAAHVDGDRTNNALGNLRWKSKKANEADKRRHGTLLQGDNAPWAKLTAEDVRQIRRRRAKGESFAAIARDMKRGYQSVYDAGTGRRWAHV